MSDALDTWKVEGVTCRIYGDDHAGNPYEELDQASELLILPPLARDYNLGETWARGEDLSSVAACVRYLTLMEGCALAIPFVFKDYGSSGARVWLTDDDSDRAAGFLVLTREKYDSEFGAAGMPLTSDDPEAHSAERTIRGEFDDFRAWVECEVYGYVVGDSHREKDACWGFYGDEKYVREEAEAAARSIAEDRREAGEKIRAEWRELSVA